MSYKAISNIDQYTGLSTDDLPASAPNGSIAEQLDTTIKYKIHDGVWYPSQTILFAKKTFTNAEILTNFSAPLVMVSPLPAGFGAVPIGPCWFILETTEGVYVTGGISLKLTVPGTGGIFSDGASGILGVVDGDLTTPQLWGDGTLPPNLASVGSVPGSAGALDNSGLVLTSGVGNYTGGNAENYLKFMFPYMIVPLL